MFSQELTPTVHGRMSLGVVGYLSWTLRSIQLNVYDQPNVQFPIHPRAATHQVGHPGPSPPGAGTQSLQALSLCLDTGAWRAMPSPLPGVQQEAFLVGDTVPLPPALPPAESPDLHSAKAVRTEQECMHGTSVWDRKASISPASPPGGTPPPNEGKPHANYREKNRG